ncbi:MAG TPA: hypothetical protein VE981_19745 [Planctomycetota bacterium]|nr:hypothetical protein [Planctomycetota bacterium]
MTTCQKCKQAPATVHLTSTDSCRQREFHFCAGCARTADMGFPVSLKPPPAPPCPDCGHLNPDNGILCSACGSVRRR